MYVYMTGIDNDETVTDYLHVCVYVCCACVCASPPLYSIAVCGGSGGSVRGIVMSSPLLWH